MKSSTLTLITAFVLTQLLCVAPLVAQPRDGSVVRDQSRAQQGIEKVANTAHASYESPTLCPSWPAQTSKRGWRCTAVLRWNKAKMVKPKCEEGDPNCDDQPYCVLVGKVRSLIVRRDYRSGKRWDEKGSLSYTCKDRKLHGSLTHKIYWKDAGLRWTVKTKFSKGAEVGVRTTKDNGKHIVEARCFSTPYTRYSENDWRSDMLWKIKIPYPDPKSHSYEGAKDVLKADLALYKAGNKVVGLMSKGCSEFVPEHCEIKNKAGLRGVCRDAKWCAKHVGRCPGFKSE